MVEECAGHANNITEASVASRFHSPSVAFGRILGSEVLNKRWKFDAVDMDAELVGRTVAFDKSAFTPYVQNWALPFNEVESNASTAPFYSPNAANTTVPMADVFLRRGFKKRHLGMENLKTAWLGQIFHHENLFAYEIPTTELANAGQWFIGIHHFPESAVYGFRLQRGTAPGTFRHCFEICNEAEPFIIPVI